MKKETIIAIIFGIIFGSIVALIILAKNKEIQLTKTKTLAPTEKLTQVAKNNNIIKQFEISEPPEGTIVSEASIVIKGKAERDSLIVVQSPSKDVVFKNDKEDFSLKFPLVNGDNSIKITMYPKDPQGRSQEKSLHVYYLNETL